MRIKRDVAPGDCVACLSQVARELFAPLRVARIALLGDRPVAAQEDIHLLVEFAPNESVITLDNWLRWQRMLRERCGCRVELVSVNRLDEQVAADVVALTILYDSAVDA